MLASLSVERLREGVIRGADMGSCREGVYKLIRWRHLGLDGVQECQDGLAMW